MIFAKVNSTKEKLLTPLTNFRFAIDLWLKITD